MSLAGEAFAPWAGLSLLLILPSSLRAQPAAAAALRDWSRFSVLTPAGPEEPKPEVFRKIQRLLWSTHKVVRGEYKDYLAKLYGTTPMSLQATNGDELYLLGGGRRLVVHNKEGKLYEVKKDSETLSHIVARNYQGGATQRRQFREWVVKANALPAGALLWDYEFQKSSRVLLPGITVHFDTYHYPFSSVPRLSSRFGMRKHPVLGAKRMHLGIDIPKPYGTPVFPSKSGVVVEQGWHEGYGMLVIVRHPDGFTTRYGHLSKIRVKVGQLVQRDKTLIGNVGSTGLSTGPHLHFEMRDPQGRPFNPQTKIGRR